MIILQPLLLSSSDTCWGKFIIMIPESIFSLLSEFHIIEKEALDEIARMTFKMELPKKGILLKEGQVCKNLYFVEKGFLRSYMIEKSGKDHTVWFSKERDFILSPYSFFNQQPSSNFIEALEDSVLYFWSFENVFHLMKNHHSCSVFGNILLIQYLTPICTKLLQLHTETAFDRYQALLEKKPDIFLRCPLNYIASYLRISRETLSRLRQVR